MHSLRELKKSLKELDSKKKRRKGSGEGDSGAIGVDRAGDDRHVGGGEDAAFVQASKANLKMPPSLEDQKASGGSCSVSADGHGDDVGVSNVRVELVDPSQQEAAVVVHTQMNKRKAPPSPRERSGANNGKKVKICMEAEEKEKNGTETEEKKVEGCCKVKNSTEAEDKKVEKNCSEETRDGGSKGSCSNGGTPDEEPTERGEGLRAGSVNEESEVSRSNYPRSLAGIGRSPNVPKVAVAVSPNMPWR
ncbi:hypothetical protein PR202_ga15357 [Eleusine coracana subsp. coracana]|uniref:Uncharacterized protein n=1 Tax=Eleusine coracana subsp. coracana TaxID=191504 RepID=A0AAV5CJH5_ELECO|nr:hypothetical protein PR202_ga15357 [Eleusine coracana subsp. coracana]